MTGIRLDFTGLSGPGTLKFFRRMIYMLWPADCCFLTYLQGAGICSFLTYLVICGRMVFDGLIGLALFLPD